MEFVLVFTIIGIFTLVCIILVLVDDYKSKHHSNGQSYTTYYDYDRVEQEQFGKAGERYVAKMLENIARFNKATVFNDYTFIDDKGYSTNIDHILVCQGGVFVIETKSNKGIIVGHESSENWGAKKEDWQDDKIFRNPVLQNQGHINHLRRMFKTNPPKMISMIIFPAADSLEYVDASCVYDVSGAEDFILEKIAEGKYSPEFVDRITNQLQDIIDEYGITLEEHRANIRKIYK